MKGRKPQHDAKRRKQTDAFTGTAIAPSDPDARGVQMPADIAADPVQSELWRWIAPPVNNFTEQDLPNLRLLVYWHAVAAQAQSEMAGGGGIAVFGKVTTENGEKTVKSPAVQVLKTASTEIRALSDMLGLSPLARSRIGLINATTVKTAADTAAMFQSIDAAYGLPEQVTGEIVEVSDA